MNKKNKEVMLSLSSVSLNIPILNNQRRTIKNLISNTVGSIIKNCNVQPMIYKAFLVNQELTGIDAVIAF